MSESKAPEKIWARVGYYGIMSGAVGSFREHPDGTSGYFEYTRTDAIMSDPRVKALVKALWLAKEQEEFDAEVENRPKLRWVRAAEHALTAIEEATND